MADVPRHPTETPKAAEAFAAYVALGDGRSLRKLAAQLAEQGVYKTSTSAMRCLGPWSREYRWQDRIAQAASERAEAMLREASNVDADTFLRSSRILNERMQLATSGHVDMVVKVRESVRKPMPKGGTSVNVTVQVEVEHLIDQIAEEDGLTADEKAELAAAVERHLSGTTS